MRRVGLFRGRWRPDVAVVLVPLLAILVLQYLSSRRLAEVELIAHQTTIARYLDAVTADVRQMYEDAAREMLDIPADVLAAKRFDDIGRHFDAVDTSAARLLFAATFDGCLCLTRYYDPAAGTVSIGAEPDVEVVVLRASTLLRLRQQQWLELDVSGLDVDEADPANRVVYRFVTGADGNAIGLVGFVLDTDRFEGEYLPRVIEERLDLLAGGVPDNLIVRVSDPGGRVVAATHDGAGQADVLAARFDFVFRDWELSARSRHTAAARILESNAFSSWALTVTMSVSVIVGVLLTWRAAGRERRLSRIRNAFVANVSHELRTPLASIAVFGEFLRCGRVTSPEKIVEYGGHIEHESNRLRHLIDNVLDFARIESAAVEYRREDAAVEDSVGAAVSAVDARRERDGFTILVTCPDTLLPAVRIDEEAMTRVFVNLLDNAMKYSGRSRRIRVDLSCRDEGVAVAVTDFGMGVAPEEQERIFDRFYRTTAPADDGVAGTGLGLAIVRQVVQAHGGRVEVDSRPGRGATFTVVIPAAGASAVRDDVGVSSAEDGPGMEAGARA